MALLQALIALIGRSAGKLLTAIFGWAVHALFGRTSPRDQTMLSAIVAAAVAWPLLALGVAAPKVAALALAFVPLPRSIPSWVVRIVWLFLAVAVPLGLGLAIASKGRPEAKAEPIVKRLSRGFPLTLGLALAFLIMFLSVPVMRAIALVRREKSADVPLATDAPTYHEVAGLVVGDLNRHGFALEAAEPGWWVKAPTRILAWFGGSAFGAFVPERLEHFEGPSIQVSFYTSGVLLRGKGQRMTWAHGLIEECVVHSNGLQTFAPKAQELERRVREIWHVYDVDPVAHRGSSALLEQLDDLRRDLAALDVAYDEWQTVYRQVLQLDRALRGEPQLLDEARPREEENNMGTKDGSAVAPPSSTLARRPAEGATAGRVHRVEDLSTPALVEKILRDASELVKTEVALARSELRADLKAELRTAKGLGAGALAAIAAINLLLMTAVLGLARVMPDWAAGLAVSSLLILAALILMRTAWGQRVRTPFAHTRHDLEEDVRWTKERTA